MMSKHTEMTKHIRNRIKAANIKAKVHMYSACGVNYICIVAPTYESWFTADEIEKISIIAQVNKLTGARGSAIDVSRNRQLIEKEQWDFEFHA
jgi:hypothetical protein